jgi:hypothetical protein
MTDLRCWTLRALDEIQPRSPEASHYTMDHPPGLGIDVPASLLAVADELIE